jgi:hypothetical protein
MSREPSDSVPCSECGAALVFLRTVNGKLMPVNADTVEPGDTDYEHGRHVSHFSTCTAPERFRKPR